MPERAGSSTCPPSSARTRSAGVNFLGRFLDAFESVFDELQDELEAIPDLFALPPTPALAVDSQGGDEEATTRQRRGVVPRRRLAPQRCRCRPNRVR